MSGVINAVWNLVVAICNLITGAVFTIVNMLWNVIVLIIAFAIGKGIWDRIKR